MGLAPFTVLGRGREERLPHGSPRIEGGLEGQRVLAPLIDTELGTNIDQLKIASTFARTMGASLQVTNPIGVPSEDVDELRRRMTAAGRETSSGEALDRLRASMKRTGGYVVHGRHIVDRVLHTVDRNDIDTLVLPGRSPSDLFGREVTELIAVQADCDVVVANTGSGYDEVPSILVAIAGGHHSGLATDVATHIAEDCGAWIDVLHVVDEDASDDQRERAREYVDLARQRIARPETTSTWVLEAENVTEAIIEQSRYYGLTVLGAPTKGRLQQFLYGSTARSIRANAWGVVLSAWNNTDSSRLDAD